MDQSILKKDEMKDSHPTIAEIFQKYGFQPGMVLPFIYLGNKRCIDQLTRKRIEAAVKELSNYSLDEIGTYITNNYRSYVSRGIESYKKGIGFEEKYYGVQKTEWTLQDYREMLEKERDRIIEKAINWIRKNVIPRSDD